MTFRCLSFISTAINEEPFNYLDICESPNKNCLYAIRHYFNVDTLHVNSRQNILRNIYKVVVCSVIIDMLQGKHLLYNVLQYILISIYSERSTFTSGTACKCYVISFLVSH